MKVTKVMLDDLFETMKKEVKRGGHIKKLVVLLDVKTNKLDLLLATLNYKNTIEAINEEKTGYLLKEIEVAYRTRSLGKYKEVFFNKVAPLLAQVDETHTPEFVEIFTEIMTYANALPQMAKGLEGVILINRPYEPLTQEEERLATYIINKTNRYIYLNPKTGVFSIDEDNACYNAAKEGKLLKHVMKLSAKEFHSSKAIVVAVLKEQPTEMETMLKFINKWSKEENNTEELIEYGCGVLLSLKAMLEIVLRIDKACVSVKKITDIYVANKVALPFK